jgi:hypothetical protein
MQYCKIYKHKSGGIILKNTVDNVVNIEECNIFRNGNCGILCDNYEAAPCLNANKIM